MDGQALIPLVVPNKLLRLVKLSSCELCQPMALTLYSCN